jgi:hypothetical protein
VYGKFAVAKAFSMSTKVETVCLTISIPLHY